MWMIWCLISCVRNVPSGQIDGWKPQAPTTDDAIYFVLVDRFSDGDSSNNSSIDINNPQGWHGGDIQGVLNNLDHIQGMGFTTVWLSPVFDSREEPFGKWGAYHGYWVDSMDSVEPRFGTTQTLQALSSELHKRDMRLVVDVVYNHTSFDSPLLTTEPDWYHEARPIENWHDPIEAQTHQVHGLPDLDQSNPEVQEYLIGNSKRWIQTAQIDGLRIDAVRHINPTFFPTLHTALSEYFGTPVSTIGEIFDGNRKTVVESWRAGGFQSVFDFPLYYAMIDSGCRGQHAGRIAANLAYAQWTDIPGTWVTFLDNHDLPRLASECGPERVPLMLAVQMTSRGRPMMTYGTESGLSGTEEPANRADMDFQTTPYLDTVLELLELRSKSNTLANGDTHIISLNTDGYVALRTSSDTTSSLVAVNLGSNAAQFELPSWLTQEWHLLYGNARFQEGVLIVPAGTVSVLERDNIRNSIPTTQTQTVHFSLKEQLESGTFKLVGEGQPLGQWNPAAAPVIPSEGLTLELPTYAVLEFKIVHESNDGTITWNNGDNDYLLIEPSNTTLNAEVTFTASLTQE